MKLKHFDHDGRARFITFCIHQRIPILSSDAFRQMIVESIVEVKAKTGFRLLAYVIMPEHVHLVLVPRIDSELGPLIGGIKRISARKIHLFLKRNNPTLPGRFLVTRDGRPKFALWQRRCFDHNCRTDAEIWESVTYCHNNPFARGLVGNAIDWQWSSYRSYLGLPDSVLEIDI
jgi:putative transposase